ncbi:MAG: hypothetical protein PHQ53_05710 [Candidatus Krumholzibacteria bacterium]|nr:hypothetical protein [Candidatus Krumholzibacteria bacterium]
MKRQLCASFVVVLLAAVGPVLADEVYEGWNDGVTGGWEPNTNRTALEVYTDGGVGNSGYLRSYEISGGWDAVGALQPNEPYVGDFVTHGYARMEVALQFFEGSFTEARFRVRYMSGSYNAWYYPLTTDFTPGIWHLTSVDFDPTWSDSEAIAAGWVQESNTPSFQQTMANVYTTEIRVMGTGELAVGLDDFSLGEPVTTIESTTWGQVKSLFDHQ